MQENQTRRSNKERTEATRAALIKAARALFIKKGYWETGTPEIAKAAKVTRGALYHHFADKTDLFRAVALHEAQTVAKRIKKETTDLNSPLEALMSGTDAYFAAMAVPGRTRLLLIDGPSILGPAEMSRIDKETGGETLRQGLAFAMSKGELKNAPLEALAEILSAAFDKAALAIAEGQSEEDYKAAIHLTLKSLLSETK